MIEWLLGCTVLLLILAVLSLVNRLNQMQEDECAGVDADHAKCIAHIASLVSDEFAARVLDHASNDFDSVENAVEQRVAREAYSGPGGRSVPSIWMSHRADRLRQVHES